MTNKEKAIKEALEQLLSRLNEHGSIHPVREEGPIQDAIDALNMETIENVQPGIMINTRFCHRDEVRELKEYLDENCWDWMDS